jgi:DNA-binding transcriptional regulator YdaS (Cro superfamily)
MTLNEYLSQESAPSASEFAKRTAACGEAIHPVTLSLIRNGRREATAEQALAIERASEGAVACESLRPDVDWRRWRDVEAARDAPIDTDNERKAA